VAPITIGSRSFLGNGAILTGSTRVADDSLVGLLTVPPQQSQDGTSWLGMPALELPRRPEPADPGRTTEPSRMLIAARAVVDLIRILAPGAISVALASLVFWALAAIGAGGGLWAMAAAAPFVLVAAGLCAVVITAGIKWVVIGRYRAGEHPLWSLFVWRDEIINSAQEQIAGPWMTWRSERRSCPPIFG
jgi:non-ribosomal peptide synthetase-like protein